MNGTIERYKAGTIERYKAKLVAKGYTQTYGTDFIETLALGARLGIITLVIFVPMNSNIHLYDE